MTGLIEFAIMSSEVLVHGDFPLQWKWQ